MGVGLRSARSFVRRDIDGAVVTGVIAVVEKCADVVPAGTGGGAKFVFGDHLIGLTKDEGRDRQAWWPLATDATGSDFVRETGERVLQIDLRNTFAPEGLEKAEKIFFAGSRRANSAVVEAEAIVGGMSGLRAAASVGEGEAAEWSVGGSMRLLDTKEV